VQPSLLKPEGETQEYGRLQVDYRTKLNDVMLSDSEYQLIINALAEGRSIGLMTESGIPIGQLIPALQGGFVVADFVQATKKDFRVGFSPNKKLLEDVRKILTFERIPTVVNNPTIISTTFTYYIGTGESQVKEKLTNQIKIATTGILRINGTQFLKDGMHTQVNQYGASALFVNMSSSGSKFSEIMINADDFPAKDWSEQPAMLTTWRTDNPTRRVNTSINMVS